MRRFLVVATVFLGLAALPRTASADLITGYLSITGTVVVTANTVDWYATGNLTDPNIAIVNDSLLFDGTTRILAPGSIFNPTLMFETNLSSATTPAGTPLNVDLFEYPLTSSLPAANVDFVLTYVNTCADQGGVVGLNCFGTSPFLFTQNTTTTGVTFTQVKLTMSGNVFDTTTQNLVSTWSGNWTAQFNGSISQIFDIIDHGGSITNTYSATKIAVAPAVPEPATLLTFGVGSFALASLSRRKKNKNKNKKA